MLRAEISGDELVTRALSRVEERISDWREVWPEVNRRFEQLERDLFASGGATGEHGAWADLNPYYEERRARQFRQPFPFPLRRTLALEHSLTQSGAEFAIVQMSSTELVRGTSRRGAGYHMERRGNTPARRPIDPTSEQVQKEILAPLRAEAKRIATREGFIVTNE